MYGLMDYTNAKQVSTALINPIGSAAVCGGVHLSKPLDSQTNWLSSAVTLCSGIPVTCPALPCTLFYTPRLHWGLCPSASIFTAEMEFDRLRLSHHSAFQNVLLHPPLAVWLNPQSTCEGAQTKHKRQLTCELHSRTTGLLKLHVVCRSLAKESTGVGGRVHF